MRTHLHAAGIALALAWTCHVLRADDPSPAIGEDGSPSLSVRAILKEAAQIAVRQDKEQGYWRDRVLLKIARIQMRAGDFDRARDSIRSADNQCDADAAVVRLAEELAGAGECERAFQVLREMGTDYDSRPDYSDDRVRMRWLEYLISTRDFGRAGLVVETFAVPRSRPEGLRMLALAYSQTGDKAASQRCLQDAIVACTAIADEFGRAKCLWRIADAQIALSEIKSASSTIEQLAVLADSFADGWARVTALRESAVRMAQIGDREAATRLFRQAIAARVSIKPPAPLPATNRIHALVRIAESQAALGYIDDALETVKLIKRNGGHMTSDSELERALHAVAVAQTKSGDISAALAVVRSFRYIAHIK